MRAEPCRVVAIIPARAGSLRLPGKNLLPVGGVSLVERSLWHARAAGVDIIVVTTDDPSVARLVRGFPDVEVQDRPPDLASETATTDEVILHVMMENPTVSDAVMLLLQPTSPFRNRSVLQECLDTARAHPDCLVLTMTAAAKQKGWLRCIDSDGVVSEPDLPCQPAVPNGAVYAFEAAAFVRAGGFAAMPKRAVLTPPVHACDIDEDFEFTIASALATAGFGDDVVDVEIQRSLQGRRT